jgi:CRISPR-associated endonuclease/helicase Cas3
LFRQEDRRALRHPLLRFPGLGSGGWQEQREILFKAMCDVVDRPVPPPVVDGATAAVITGIVILADWLASQESFLQARLAAMSEVGHDVATQFHSSYEQAPDLLEAAGLQPVGLRRASFADSFDFTPNPLQHSILDELPDRVGGPGLLLITAATGDGKTEAGLTAARMLGDASGMPGLFFALPNMATADEMYKRVVRYVRRLADAPTPVTLLHSMAWLREAFETNPVADGDAAISSDDAESLVAAPQWLRGPKRGLLAPVAVGTIDQALMSVLQLKHNVLRQLALAGKVLVVDECHAYDPYMQGLLRRLLTWLGALRCPVVLMSATLPASIAQSLVAAYVSGAGHQPVADEYAIDYPGWLYVPADTGEPVHVSAAARAKIAAHRTAALTVDLCNVRHLSSGAGEGREGERLTALRGALAPMTTKSGCVAVVCNTVADAQETYNTLRQWLGGLDGDPPRLDLLHSRFTAREREQRTQAIVNLYSKDGTRPPRGGIVVATQVIEQSLDLDFDLIISDLAPLAQLLQRAGRGHRHERTDRPSWAKDHRLVVLVPVDAGGRLSRPQHWGTVYPEFLLASTHRTLTDRGVSPINIPGDVGELMELAYNPPSTRPEESFTSDQALTEHWIDYEGDALAQQSLAELLAVPPPSQIRELSLLSRDDLTETHATTRMGADSVRALAVHRDANGVLWLDPNRRHRLPEKGSGRQGRFIRDDLAGLLMETIPVPERWVRDRNAEHNPPQTWEENTWLRELVLLPHDSDGTGASIGGRTLRLDHDLGLVRE